MLVERNRSLFDEAPIPCQWELNSSLFQRLRGIVKHGRPEWRWVLDRMLCAHREYPRNSGQGGHLCFHRSDLKE